MGDALIELELSLRATKEKLTREEERILQTCKADGIRGFTIGGLVACGFVWMGNDLIELAPPMAITLATRRLSYAHRFFCSGGAAAVCGMWNCDRTLNSWLDHILAMNGSRMQSMLAGIILTRHQHNPRRLQLVKKHFYPEKVYDDSSVDQPFSRWRNRNFSGENVSAENAGQSNHENIRMAKPNQAPEQFTITPAEDITVDPLDCILGYAKPGDEIRNAETTGISFRRRHPYGHKRAHRRRLPQHLENSFSHETRKQYVT